MLVIQIKNNDNLEKSLKLLKSKVIKTKQNKILLDKKEFTKKSVLKRNQILNAKYKQKKENS